MMKRTKVETVFPPREIRDMPSGKAATTARREFLARVKAEKEAAGFVCTITGSGSYEVVNVFREVEVASRTQMRGVCQACGGQQAIVRGVVALHGYTRPGDGYTVGRCYGSGCKPANVEVTITRAVITMCEETAAKLRAEAAAVRAEEEAVGGAQFRAAVLEIVRKTSAAIAAGKHMEARELREAARKEALRPMYLEREADANADHAAMLAAHVLPALGTALVAVEV